MAWTLHTLLGMYACNMSETCTNQYVSFHCYYFVQNIYLWNIHVPWLTNAVVQLKGSCCCEIPNFQLVLKCAKTRLGLQLLLVAVFQLSYQGERFTECLPVWKEYSKFVQGSDIYYSQGSMQPSFAAKLHNSLYPVCSWVGPSLYNISSLVLSKGQSLEVGQEKAAGFILQRLPQVIYHHLSTAHRMKPTSLLDAFIRCSSQQKLFEGSRSQYREASYINNFLFRMLTLI